MKTYSSPVSDHKRKRISCVICSSQDYRNLWSFDGCSFVKCNSCSAVYQNPQPSMEELVERYSGNYLEYELENEDQFLAIMKKSFSDMELNEIFSSFPDSSIVNFLDIGCATGKLLDYLREQYGFQPFGVEISQEMADFAARKRGIQVSRLELESSSYESEFFDVIHSSHVIEHVRNPLSFIAETARILKPGGYCICTTPNISSLQARVFGPQWRSAIADHLTLFSKTQLIGLVEQKGLKLVNSLTWGGWAQGAPLSWLKKPLDRLSKMFGFGDVMMLVFRKSL
jgi:2-polyprenyl-3-methyl-5-hydroxy-6-metoxy-1,4-benzoquinol methylase